MGQQRDSYQCRIRYSRLLLAQIVHTQPAQPWTNDEVLASPHFSPLISSLDLSFFQDDRLKEAVQKTKEVNNNAVNWRLVAEYMDRTRTPRQCQRRWTLLLPRLLGQPRPVLTPWSAEEVSCLACLPDPFLFCQDDLLKEIYRSVADPNRKNVRWRVIAERMGNRTPTECRRRWAIISLTNRTHWLPDEVCASVLSSPSFSLLLLVRISSSALLFMSQPSTARLTGGRSRRRWERVIEHLHSVVIAGTAC
jgi:hypothetical protein